MIAPSVAGGICSAEVRDDDKRNSSTKCDRQLRRPTRCGKGLGGGSHDNRCDVLVGLLRESGEGRLHPGGLRRGDQFLYQVKPLTGGMEVGYGNDGKTWGDGGSHAGGDGDLA